MVRKLLDEIQGWTRVVLWEIETAKDNLDLDLHTVGVGGLSDYVFLSLVE